MPISLEGVVPPEDLIPSGEGLSEYARDQWLARSMPEAVVLARSAETVSRLLAHAHRHRIPVTARGAGYGYVGGCVPARGGIVLSTERMNRILEISPGDFIGVVEPGVVTADFQREARRHSRFYPPDPASLENCSLGGNIATNAGGPRCLKYGVTRDYVLGLEVVLADGSMVSLGSRCHKNKTGFDLHRLFVGSEGLLGVITRATLKLLPLPPCRACLSVGHAAMERALESVDRVFDLGFLPAALEVADEFTLEAAARRTGSDLFSGCRAHLLVEIDGGEGAVRSELDRLEEALREMRPVFVRKGMGEEGCDRIWEVRREFSFALRDTGLTKLNQDIVVPRSRLPDLFAHAAGIRERHRIPTACFGHAGDGNIHVNLMVDHSSPESRERSRGAVDELFDRVLRWGGVITGEHGIGLARMPWWESATSAPVRDLHHRIKTALDPRGILNPGKFAASAPENGIRHADPDRLPGRGERSAY